VSLEPNRRQPPIPARSAVDNVASAIREAILRGDFRPGEDLPEVPLAHQFSASRGTVREALRDLAELGLADIFPNRGAFVSSLSGRKALEIFGLRSVLEGYAARLGVESGQLRGENLTRIEEGYRVLQEAATSGDLLAVAEADMEFHRRVSTACGQEIVLESLARLQIQTRRFILATKLYESDLEGEAESHLPILRALTSGDPERADLAVRDHITRTGQLLLARMASSTPGSVLSP
jgi:DNA-binding GntR family transcriptional regulator